MTAGRSRRVLDMGLAALLLVLPALALAPPLREARLLGPGDGVALHFPLRAAVWDAYRHGEMPGWNRAQYLGTPLLAAYRPGALYPPMAALAVLPRFVAFQALVVLSLGAAGALLFAYLRRLGAHPVGAYVAGLSFGLGPYLMGHLGDTATLVAAPTLPLLLLAAEGYAARDGARSRLALAAALALLLLAGSPEAARGGLVLLAARLLALHARDRGRSLLSSAWAVAAGALLAAPQLLPTLLAARGAGRAVTGVAGGMDVLPGATGLALRYLSHTPAPALALAALPLVASVPAVPALAVGLVACLVLQWGRGPLAAPGALALVFDLVLAVLAGLSLSAQWRARREPLGRRLRASLLFALVLSALSLSLAASVVGPLPQTLAGAVGILAVAMILYETLAGSLDRVYASLWLLPLTVSFVLQPHGRRAWEGAPTRAEIERPSGTREALERAMGPLRGARTLTLVREWPGEQADDLAYAGLGALEGRRSANGYDPMVPLPTRRALGSMAVGGTLPPGFFASDPARLQPLGIRWVQVPVFLLEGVTDADGRGERVDMRVSAEAPRFVPLPMTVATDVRIVSSLADAVPLPQGTLVATVEARLASGRSFSWPLRAGVETAEWAWDRPDVRALVAHDRPEPAETFDEKGVAGHRYAAMLPLPGRYYLDAVRIVRAPGPGQLTVFRIALLDRLTGRSTPASGAAAFLSDTARFREAAATPAVRLFEVPRAAEAFVAARVRAYPGAPEVLGALSAATRSGVDLASEALVEERDRAGLEAGPGGRASRAEVSWRGSETVDVHAEGPGVLVLSEAYDPGWSARVDGRDTPLTRVDQALLGLPLGPGAHSISYRYTVRGLVAGLALCAAAAAALGASLWRERRTRGAS